MSDQPWIGVDLDGTLAHYDGWKADNHIGAPVPLMVARVKGWLAEGKDVRIVTARVAGLAPMDRVRIVGVIYNWCVEHIGQALLVTCQKDFGMVELYDDRAVQVIMNKGITLEESLNAQADAKHVKK